MSKNGNGRVLDHAAAVTLVCCECDAPGPTDREQAAAEGWQSVGHVGDPLFSYSLPICPECAREWPHPSEVLGKSRVS